MLRGYRGIVAALGLILLGAGPPQGDGGQKPQASAEQKKPALREFATAVNNANEPSHLDEPCEEGDDQRSSDLCAQWKAADAASESAGWASWFFWLTVIGTAIGASTLGAAAAAAFFAKKAADHTETGAKAATNAVAETKRIGEAQVRAYLSIKSAHVWIDRNGQPWVKIVVVNSGQSPAREFRWAHHVVINSPDPKFHWIAEPCELLLGSATTDIPTGETEPLTTAVVAKQLSSEEMEMFRASGKTFFKVKIHMAWEDIFERIFQETYNFQALLEGRNAASISQKLYPDTAAVQRTENDDARNRQRGQ